LKFGGIADIGIARNVSFQPGLLFSQKGTKLKFSTANGGNIYYYTDKLTINYLEIPMNIQFLFGPSALGRVFVGGGPYVAFASSGRFKEEVDIRYPNGQIAHSEDETKLHIGDTAFDDVKGTDVGLNLNTGFMGRRGWLLRVNLGVGLSKVTPFRERNFGVGLSVAKLFGM
jgi:hypothetical protein